MSEYTWNELNDEGLPLAMNGHTLTALAGPELLGDTWWAPGTDEAGKPWDLYFEKRGFGETEGFALTAADAACLEND
jgi:hypothetical protein